MDTRKIASAAAGLRHVFLHDIRLDAQIGAYAHERGRTQKVRIDVDLAVEDDGANPLSQTPVGHEDLSRVVDYAQVAAKVRRIVAAGHILLVETLAERIAEACLQDRRVQLARVRVEKMSIFNDIGAAGVEIERRQV